MSIKFDSERKFITIETKNTAYVMAIDFDKYLTHVYYGKKGVEINRVLEYYGANFSPYLPEGEERYNINDAMAELPQFGSGDYGTDAVRVANKNGDSVTLFEYRSHRIFDGRQKIEGLPYAEAADKSETLEITLFDEVSCCELKLYYTVYPDEDVITRHFIMKNVGEDDVYLENAMSLSLDIERSGLDLLSFYGSHEHERTLQRTPIGRFTSVMESRRGATGHMMTNSFIVADSKATEEAGEAFGFSLVYSGSFRNSVEVNHQNNTRVVVGIHPDQFRWKLASGESFSTPEAMMTYTEDGIGQVSRNMHRFIRRYIVRPCSIGKRPVVLNTWEGVFFNLDEDKMMDFAYAAKECGVDMLVMDDGWFGKRYSDHAGLGDWQANPERFKNGLPAFVKRIKEVGINFGIWIEPEMINPDSDLFRAHPEWVLQTTGRRSTLCRHQMVLDMANPAVVEYLKATFAETFNDVPIDYIKWDFNRNLSEVSSLSLPADRRGETYHRFMLGVYDLYQWFCDTYPNVMIENCSGGGGRYDLGMMKYSSMIWTSDNTTPDDRIKIQYGSSFCYPACVMSCHVSNHGNSIENAAETDYRWKVAMQGMLGYELDATKISDEAKARIKSQIGEYSKYQEIIEKGDLYRLMSPFENDGKSAGYYVSEDGRKILVYYYQPKGEEPREYRLKVKVENGTVWNAAFNNYSPYHAFDLNTGIVVRSSAEDHYAQVYLFELNNELIVKPISVGGVDSMYDRVKPGQEKEAPLFQKWVSDEKMSDAAAAALAEEIRGNEKFEKLVREFECKKITSLEGDKEGYLFKREDDREMFVMFYQPKGETPREYRLRVDVPLGSAWVATLNRHSDYHGTDFYSGLVAKSVEQDDHIEIFHFYRRK
ncbi:MAG: alpha-galactosidase [Clostridia bacterium]|nr:alpha-galactosidase [Clostridia bacterium]